MLPDDLKDFKANWSHEKLEHYIQLLLNKLMDSHPKFDITINETEYRKYYTTTPEETVKFTFKIVPTNDTEKRVTIILQAPCLGDYHGMSKLDSRLGLAGEDFYEGGHLRDLVMRRILGAINEVLSICFYYGNRENKMVIGVLCSYLPDNSIAAKALNKDGININGGLNSELLGLRGKTKKWHPPVN